jgi:L-iditol 2-dehydrogenase
LEQKMRAVQLFAPGDVRCVEVDVPHIKKGDDVIIKVKACGVCGSDIPRVMVKGAYKYPITIGHEFAGQVVEVGSDAKKVKLGDRVSVMPLVPCGKCDYCKIGEAVMCDNYDYYGSRMDGAMAEYISVCADNILFLPDGVDYESGCMTDPMSVALHSVRKCGITPGETTLVFGMGAIGYLTVQWMKAVGAGKVIAVDIYDDKLKLAKMLGADYVINGRTEDVEKKVMEYTGGEGVAAAVELAGSKYTQEQALRVVRKMGKVVYTGISYDDLLIPSKTLAKILRGELHIMGSWNSSISPLPVNEWVSSLQFMKKGIIQTEPLISHRYRLEDCQTAFNMMYNKTEVFTKVIFKPED